MDEVPKGHLSCLCHFLSHNTFGYTCIILFSFMIRHLPCWLMITVYATVIGCVYIQCIHSVYIFSVYIQCIHSVYTFSVYIQCIYSVYTFSVCIQCMVIVCCRIHRRNLENKMQNVNDKGDLKRYSTDLSGLSTYSNQNSAADIDLPDGCGSLKVRSPSYYL